MPIFIIVSIGMTFISCARLNHLLGSSCLSVTTPGDRKKGMLIQDVGSIRSAPLFLVMLPLGRIKRAPLTPQSETCMFVIFASRISLPMVVLRDIENLFIINRPVFSGQVCANAFTGKACYRDT